MNQDDRVLSDQERLRRIGDLLCSAIIESGLAARSPDDATDEMEHHTEAPAVYPVNKLMVAEDRVIRYLSSVGEASPGILRTVLQLPRTSAYRVLNGLVESGRITSNGQTRTLVYRLGALPPHHQNVEGN